MLCMLESTTEGQINVVKISQMRRQDQWLVRNWFGARLS